MTNQEINEAIAIAIGEYTPYSEEQFAEECRRCDEINKEAHPFLQLTQPTCGVGRIRNFCSCLTAAHEAEAHITVEQMGRYLSCLANIVAPQANYHPLDMQWWMVRATARQRAEAFLRTIGKWKD